MTSAEEITALKSKLAEAERERDAWRAATGLASMTPEEAGAELDRIQDGTRQEEYLTRAIHAETERDAAQARVAVLEAAIREAYEAWAGSECSFQAETAPEAYALRVIEEMLQPLKGALRQAAEEARCVMRPTSEIDNSHGRCLCAPAVRRMVKTLKRIERYAQREVDGPSQGTVVCAFIANDARAALPPEDSQ